MSREREKKRNKNHNRPRTSDLTLVVTTRAKTFSSMTRQEYD